jgi:Flp pilus assembly protein TadD
MRRIDRSQTVGGVVVAAALFWGATSLAGCGGDDGSKQAKSPTKPVGDAGAAPAAAAASNSTPTDTSSAPDEHSDLSGAAKTSYDRGWAAWQSGDLKAAKAAFTAATQQDSHAPAPHYALGVVLQRLGSLPDAQQEYRAAFTFQPDYEVAMGAYALSLAYGGHQGEADTFLTDKHSRTPSSALITTYLSMVKSLEGDSGSAQQLAQDALKLDPNAKEAMMALARDYYRTHRNDLALYALKAILDGVNAATPPRDKDNAEAHLLRGLIEKQDGHRAAPMVDFQAAQAKRPDLVEATIQLGVMKLEAGNAAEATPLLELAVKFAPTDAVAHVNLGDSYRLMGRTADAKHEIQTALQLDSTLAVAHYDLGLLYLFSPSVPGYQPLDQVAQAIRELETYKTMRGKLSPGQSDDSDDLLSRAKAKQAELKAPPVPAAAPAAPAASVASSVAGAAPSGASASAGDAGANVTRAMNASGKDGGK